MSAGVADRHEGLIDHCTGGCGRPQKGRPPPCFTVWWGFLVINTGHAPEGKIMNVKMNRDEVAAWNARASRLRAQTPVASVPVAPMGANRQSGAITHAAAAPGQAAPTPAPTATFTLAAAPSPRISATKLWEKEYPRLVAEQRQLGAPANTATARATAEFDRLYPGARATMNSERTDAHFARIFRH
jgi:hypothetical protein